MKGEENVAKDSGGKQLVVIFAGDVCNLHTFQSMIHDVFFCLGKCWLTRLANFLFQNPLFRYVVCIFVHRCPGLCCNYHRHSCRLMILGLSQAWKTHQSTS